MQIARTSSIVVLVCGLASPSLAADGDYYQRFMSLIDTNMDHSSLTGKIVRLGALRRPNAIAGVGLGMSMTEVVRVCGKPGALYSNCSGGPLLSYVSAGFGFKADKLERISLNSWEPAEVTPALSGDWDYYERLISLIDTNNPGAFLTNGILPVEKMRTDGEIAGLRLGSSMSEAVRVWGKPHTLFCHKGGGAVLAYGFGSLEFNGEKLSIIRLCLLNSPEVRFDHGLTGQSTQGEFAEALGFGILANDTLELSRKSGTVQLTLTWANYTSGKKLVWIRLDRPRLPGKQP